jgi:hypothetical protein
VTKAPTLFTYLFMTKPKIRIETTDAIRRFNANLELADLALGVGAADEVINVRKLVTLLRLAGHFELAGGLLAAWEAIGSPGDTSRNGKP